MAQNAAHFLKDHQDQLSKIINFFCSSYLNKDFNIEKTQFGREKSKQSDTPNYEFLINSGWFSLEDYYDFNFSKETLKYDVIEPIMELLCDNSILLHQSSTTGLKFYKPNSTYFKNCRNVQYIFNHLFGFGYIIEKYRQGIYKIEVKDNNGDVSLGTGFLFKNSKGNFLVTNKHVVEGFKLTIKDVNNRPFEFGSVKISPSTDIAVIELNGPIDAEPFIFSPKMNILDSIITMGYPIVPMSRDAYLLCHSGEINSFIQHYNGQEYFIISAKTSSGNSGSPVIDPYGQVVGMITEELFEESQFFTKGKLPYYAAIPASDIMKFIDDG